ncbi:unnamed protein product [Pleuronectes platessa]|uniref:Uncharacterized protein n=1 Tax=Pleuronectes platessa TaxID=8262 RepID=A0A9N7UW18_PLEPL|nr:unnamed protein product [Pleuronectes platessa]
MEEIVQEPNSDGGMKPMKPQMVPEDTGTPSIRLRQKLTGNQLPFARPPESFMVQRVIEICEVSPAESVPGGVLIPDLWPSGHVTTAE